MPDRVIRDELLESDRWLDLPSDSHRLLFSPVLIVLSDDLGNLEGGRRLWRRVRDCTQIKTEADFAKILTDLLDADLIRRYEVAGKEYFHLPRSKPHRQYLSAKCPASPWDKEVILGKRQRILRTRNDNNQDVSNKCSIDIDTTSLPCSIDVAEGVGVGVGVGEGEVLDVVCRQHLIADQPAISDPHPKGACPTAPDAAEKKPIKYGDVVALYHEILPDCPKVQWLTDARKASIRARMAGGSKADVENLDEWRMYFERVARSRFLTGKVDPKPGQRRFRADFDWLIKEANLVKVTEGKYDDGQTAR